VGVEADLSELDPASPDFIAGYAAARATRLASPEAELLWLGFAQLCAAHGERRAIRRAMLAGLYFTDMAESPAESLLVARCVELGFAVPLLQVTILDPEEGRALGRVDGLWASMPDMKGLYEEDGRHGRRLYSMQRGDGESLVVEFDGLLKYQQGYADALESERLRQNAISNLGFRFVRVGWDDLMHPSRLKSMFKAARVPRAARRPR
jgi:hypothetical protein